MTLLLAFLLVTGLPWVETNVTVTGRQNVLRCHVCEDSNFNCSNPKNCDVGDTHCATVAVRLFVRFLYVSKQCTRFCALIPPNEMIYKSFILKQPTPFLYIACCRRPLCNTQQPVINETEWHYYKEVSQAGDIWSHTAGLVLVLTLTSVSLGLRLS